VRILLIAVLLVLAGPAYAITTDVIAPIRVYELDGITRDHYPMKHGLAFEDSTLDAIGDIRVCYPDHAGTIANYAAVVRTSWPSGFPRWVDLHYPIAVNANEESLVYVSDADSTLYSNMNTQLDAPTKVWKNISGADSVIVGNQPFSPIEEVWHDEDGDGVHETKIIDNFEGVRMKLNGDPGTWHTATTDVSTLKLDGDGGFVSIFESSGTFTTAPPANTSITWSNGNWICSSDTLEFEVRTYLYHSIGAARIDYILHNPGADSPYWPPPTNSNAYRIEDLEMRWDTNFDKPQVTFDGGSKELTTSSTDNRIKVYQEFIGDYDGNAFIRNNWWEGQIRHDGWRAIHETSTDSSSDLILAEGDSTNGGWITVSGTRGTSDQIYYVSVGIEHFSQNFPTAVSADGTGDISAHLVGGEQTYSVALRGGEMKMWTVYLVWGEAGATAEHDELGRIQQFNHPLYAVPDPSWQVYTKCWPGFAIESKVTSMKDWAGVKLRMGQWHTSRDSARTANDIENGVLRDGYLDYPHLVNSRAGFGWNRFGNPPADFESPQFGDMSNAENDQLFGLLIQSARDGDAKWLRDAYPMAKAMSGFAVYNQAGNHDSQHGQRTKFDGGFYEHDAQGDARIRGRNGVPAETHYNARGMFQAALVFAEDFFGDAATKVADNIRDTGTRDCSDELRIAAWYLEISVAAWEYTGDEKYDDRIDTIIDCRKPANTDEACWIVAANGIGQAQCAGTDRDWVAVRHIANMVESMVYYNEYENKVNGSYDADADSVILGYSRWILKYGRGTACDATEQTNSGRIDDGNGPFYNKVRFSDLGLKACDSLNMGQTVNGLAAALGHWEFRVAAYADSSRWDNDFKEAMAESTGDNWGGINYAWEHCKSMAYVLRYSHYYSKWLSPTSGARPSDPSPWNPGATPPGTKTKGYDFQHN
jgi:hypothetical protein